MQRYEGTLAEWNDARGFGFIQLDAGSNKCFLHISAFSPRLAPEQRPRQGQRLEFVVTAQGGQLRAEEARLLVMPERRRQLRRVAGSSGNHLLRYLPLALLLLAWSLLQPPLWLAGLYLGLSLLALGVYWKDKRAAQSGAWRTPESTLHLIALFGGWPGALLAQQWLRHKSSKPAFRRVFWATCALNLLALVWLLQTAAGQAWLLQLGLPG